MYSWKCIGVINGLRRSSDPSAWHTACCSVCGSIFDPEEQVKCVRKNRSLRLALLSGAAVALASMVGAGAAQPRRSPPPASTTYQLNTPIINGSLASATSHGTVTYTDNGNSVDVTIDLADHSNGASQMTMNYTDTKFPISGHTWSVSGDANCITASENGVQADGYTTGASTFRNTVASQGRNLTLSQSRLSRTHTHTSPTTSIRLISPTLPQAVCITPF
jgi:hypothetical protein